MQTALTVISYACRSLHWLLNRCHQIRYTRPAKWSANTTPGAAETQATSTPTCEPHMCKCKFICRRSPTCHLNQKVKSGILRILPNNFLMFQDIVSIQPAYKKCAMLFGKSIHGNIYCLFLHCPEYQSYEQLSFIFVVFAIYIFLMVKSSTNYIRVTVKQLSLTCIYIIHIL